MSAGNAPQQQCRTCSWKACVQQLGPLLGLVIWDHWPSFSTCTWLAGSMNQQCLQMHSIEEGTHEGCPASHMSYVFNMHATRKEWLQETMR
jgi:hypothetical protein